MNTCIHIEHQMSEYICRRLVIRYLENERREHKSIRSILGEHEAQVLDWFEPFEDY
jgi:hypothetical protein